MRQKTFNLVTLARTAQKNPEFVSFAIVEAPAEDFPPQLEKLILARNGKFIIVAGEHVSEGLYSFPTPKGLRYLNTKQKEELDNSLPISNSTLFGMTKAPDGDLSGYSNFQVSTYGPINALKVALELTMKRLGHDAIMPDVYGGVTKRLEAVGTVYYPGHNGSIQYPRHTFFASTEEYKKPRDHYLMMETNYGSKGTIQLH
jgi:hypothetical protein